MSYRTIDLINRLGENVSGAIRTYANRGKTSRKDQLTELQILKAKRDLAGGGADEKKSLDIKSKKLDISKKQKEAKSKPYKDWKASYDKRISELSRLDEYSPSYKEAKDKVNYWRKEGVKKGYIKRKPVSLKRPNIGKVEKYKF